ncbi:hypothetical protein BD779DRAFT_1477835 [Infundibulicybe gibba]|nr:hypothetical protein BD779DRAFT_1477835 [Infundibulicybe gibba]
MPRSDISESTELDIIDEMILLPTSGCGTFSLGPNGFDRCEPYSHWIITIGKPEIPLQAVSDYDPVLSPRAQHNCHDNWTRNRSNIIGRLQGSLTINRYRRRLWRLWDGPDELQNERILPRPSRWEQDAWMGIYPPLLNNFDFLSHLSPRRPYYPGQRWPSESTRKRDAQHTSRLLFRRPTENCLGTFPIANHQPTTRMSTRSNGDGSRVAVFQQVSDGSPFNLQPVESNSGGFLFKITLTSVDVHGEMLGPGSWREITDKYFEDDGEIIHPMDSERVLSIQDESREPSFILRGTFMKKNKTSSINQMCDFSSSGNWPDAPRNWECNHHVSMGPKWEVRPSGSGVPDAGPGFGTAASSSFLYPPSQTGELGIASLPPPLLSQTRESGGSVSFSTTALLSCKQEPGRLVLIPPHERTQHRFPTTPRPRSAVAQSSTALSHNMVTNSHRPASGNHQTRHLGCSLRRWMCAADRDMRKPAQPVLLCSIPPPHYRLLSPSYGWLDPANA